MCDQRNQQRRADPLPRYQSDPRPVYALHTEKDKLPLKVQVCINYLTEYFDVVELFQGMVGEDERNNPFIPERIGPMNIPRMNPVFIQEYSFATIRNS